VRTESLDDLLQQLGALAWKDAGHAAWDRVLREVQSELAGDHSLAASSTVADLRQAVRRPDQELLPAWQAEDAAHGLDQLQRRLGLIQSGILQP
jgi:hypothetical protein